MARKIVLNGPALDRHGRYRDAGEELVVGSDANKAADLGTAEADALIERGIAVTLAEAREAAAEAEG